MVSATNAPAATPIEPSRRYTTYLIIVATPTITWLVVGVGMALGQWLTVFLRPIPPGQELEAIAT